jgi:hypothetical protein
MADTNSPPPSPFINVVRPPCPKCGTTMMLARIEPEEPGFDLRTFECPACGALDTRIIAI